MRRHKKIIFLTFLLTLIITSVFIANRYVSIEDSRVQLRTKRLRSEKYNTESIPDAVQSTLVPSRQISPTPTIPPTPTPVEYTIVIVNGPDVLTEGDIATFTWQVDGLPKTIHTTAVYYGTASTPGSLAKGIAPADTNYTDVLKDFISGTYVIPLRFVGSIYGVAPGTYFFRLYAQIDGKHYWSGERSFVVKPKPKHEITVVNYPETVRVGENVAFTWEINGPSATTGYTVIVGGKESKPGTLDTSVGIQMTPYTVMVNDFAKGANTVPLRFIGNTSVADPGVYFFRAFAFINDKNVWSGEYSFLVK